MLLVLGGCGFQMPTEVQRLMAGRLLTAARHWSIKTQVMHARCDLDEAVKLLNERAYTSRSILQIAALLIETAEWRLIAVGPRLAPPRRRNGQGEATFAG